jgi:hypothetical protein
MEYPTADGFEDRGPGRYRRTWRIIIVAVLLIAALTANQVFGSHAGPAHPRKDRSPVPTSAPTGQAARTGADPPTTASSAARPAAVAADWQLVDAAVAT